MQKINIKFLEYDYENEIEEIKINSLKRKISPALNNFLQKSDNRAKALNYFQFIYSNFDDDNSIDEETIKDKKDQLYFYYYVFPILLNDGIFFNENKNKFYSEYFTECIVSNKLYKIFEEESSLIIVDDEMNANYKQYYYSLNPTSQFHIKNEYMIKTLWLRYFSKTFHNIPISKKKYYFDLMNIFLKKNKNLIDERTLLILFNCLNKYGDRIMNQEYFNNLKNKTYTSYLCLREKTKPENNFIKYTFNKDILNKNSNDNNINLININQNITELKPSFYKGKKENNNIMNFRVNFFCNGKNEELNLYQNSESNLNTDSDENNVCNEPFMEKISELYSDSDEYIQCKCNKCFKDQRLSISCEYNNEDNDKYLIDFELLSPMALLTQEWFQNNSELDLSYISEEYLESYLSAIFYFNEQNLPFEFLIPDLKNENELKITKNLSYSNINSKDYYDINDIYNVIVSKNIKKGENEINNTDVIEEDNDKKDIKERKSFKSCFNVKHKKSAKNVEFKINSKSENETNINDK